MTKGHESVKSVKSVAKRVLPKVGRPKGLRSASLPISKDVFRYIRVVGVGVEEHDKINGHIPGLTV